ncbi:MAG: cell division protein FtsK [Rickettsiales bacterium]|nr:cell division protein FtsK [Rickettsiales bacterium]
MGGVNGAFVLDHLSYIPTFLILILSLVFSLCFISIIAEISFKDWSYFFRYFGVISGILMEKLAAVIVKKREEYIANRRSSRREKIMQEESEDLVGGSLLPESNIEQDHVIEPHNMAEEKEELKSQLKSIKSRKSSGSKYQLPPIDLLADRSLENKDKKVSKQSVNEQSEMLIKVLEDFGVRGTSLGASIGPVITLHEFEPAAGTKAARVVGLSEDIARTMSAVSARIAVVAGKTSIGIELPNPKRQMIFFRELIESKHFRFSQDALPMILGKDIGGEIVVADMAKMPHLLIAGTTGSGKSVGLNVMILSLLFKLRPDECKFIMIDPKMLELSIYDGIPHLLSPVVTDPNKAVVALKWAVAEMEERYRLMSSFAVRNISGYNEKVEKAAMDGKKLKRKVQTGYDPTNGQPIIEEIEFEPKKLPYIVVIIDEMADLMLVAGKEIEGLVQRLAQMARAAGIHVIMATQRPSVDVITGVIKANFPTRISFQVTSRIDSRTILGEQGAEQLLGKGDMIYMSGGSKKIRVHGPFCSDTEIENIVNFIKDQDLEEFGEGERVSFESSTNIAAPASAGVKDMQEGGGSDEDLYTKAVAIVRRDKKASISYIQRQLRIGYNRAANLVEKMEEEGVVSAPNISGKREVLEAE